MESPFLIRIRLFELFPTIYLHKSIALQSKFFFKEIKQFYFFACKKLKEVLNNEPELF